MINIAHRNHAAASRGRVALSAGALVLGSALLLSGCAAPAEPGADASAEGDVEIVFLNQSRGQEAALTQLAEQYTEETGITVTVDSPGPADFPARLQAASQSDSMPDIFSSLQQTDMAPYIKAGWAMDLTAELDGEWGETFDPQVIELSTFSEGNVLGVEPGIYSAHWETGTDGIYVNPEMTGISVDDAPATTEDFIDALAASDDSGTGLFSVAAGLTPYMMQAHVSNWLTDEEISATFRGEESWESDGWRNAFQLLVDMKDAGVIANGALVGGADDNPTVEADFFSNQTLGSIFDHAAGVSVGLRTAPDFQDYATMALPAAADGDLDPRARGSIGKGAAVNPKGDHPEEALAFVKWLTEADQQSVFAEVGYILPSNVELLEAGDVPEQLQGFAEAVPTLQRVSDTFAPDVRSAIIAESQRLVLGEITVDELLANVQSAQDRVS